MTDTGTENSEELFKTLKRTVAKNAQLLYQQRDRVGRKEEDSSWPSIFQNDLKKLKVKLQEQLLVDNTHKFTKILKLTLEVIEGFTIKHPQTKLPSAPINYLEIDLQDHHINWILKNLKIQWVRFNQLYWQLWFEDEMRRDF